MFHLETKIKENAPKVDRLYDYETQINQLIKLQRLWYVVEVGVCKRIRSNGTRREADVHKINDSKEYLAAFASKYRKMEFRLDAFENAQVETEQNAA